MKTFHAAVSFCEAMSGIQPQHQLRIFFFVHIFLCGRQHQLQAVELIYFAGTRIVIDGYDIGQRIAVAQLFDHAFAYDMVWKAGKWLDTYDIVCTAVDQLQHFSG